MISFQEPDRRCGSDQQQSADPGEATLIGRTEPHQRGTLECPDDDQCRSGKSERHGQGGKTGCQHGMRLAKPEQIPAPDQNQGADQINGRSDQGRVGNGHVVITQQGDLQRQCQQRQAEDQHDIQLFC